MIQTNFVLINDNGSPLGEQTVCKAPSENFVKDDFTSMCLESNFYHFGRLSFLIAWTVPCVTFLIAPIFSVIGIAFALVKILIHSACCLFRLIQIPHKMKNYQPDNLEGKYRTHDDLNFLKRRLSFINHRNEIVGSLFIIGACVGMLFPFLGGLVGIPFIGYKLNEALKARNEKYGSYLVEKKLQMWRCPNERTLLIEHISVLKIDVLKEDVEKGIQEDITKNKVVLASGQGLPQVIVDLTSQYYTGDLKKNKYQYWQEASTLEF